MTREQGLARVAEVIRGGTRFLATVHVRPDGDAVGSLLGFALGLRLLGKEVLAVTQDPIPANYGFLPEVGTIRQELPPQSAAASYDAGVALDCDGLDRCGTVGPLLTATGLVVDIDHHAGTKAFGDVTCVVSDACCTGELVLALLTEHLGVTLTPEIATCLFAAHAYDTGRFTHRNTTARTFEDCAQLVAAGAEPEPIIRGLFESRSLARVCLRGVALERARLDPASGVAWSHLTPRDFTHTGALAADTDGIVDELRAVEGCAAAVLVSELEPRVCRVSIRVRESQLNAARVCATFGGGGHVRAAGCTIEDHALSAARRVLDAIQAEMAEPTPADED